MDILFESLEILLYFSTRKSFTKIIIHFSSIEKLFIDIIVKINIKIFSEKFLMIKLSMTVLIKNIIFNFPKNTIFNFF